MNKIDLNSVTQWITAAAQRCGALHGAAGLVSHVMQRLDISRPRARKLLQTLVDSQWLRKSGSRNRPSYSPGPMRQVVQRYALAGLQEDQPWRHDFAPFFELPDAVLRMAQHAMTELLNNAIDHSGGSTVAVSMRQTATQLQLMVSDDGCGLFAHLQTHCGIPDAQTAVLELSKGKLTSAPAQHSGQGLFVVSQLADVLDLQANEAAFQRRAWASAPWQHSAVSRKVQSPGTTVYLAIPLDTARSLDQVLRARSSSGQAYANERTVVPLHVLSQDAGGVLATRAEAKRAVARLALFKSAEIDFAGVHDIGQGFADEMFRVFRQRHPQVELVPLRMSPRVAEMVYSATA
jgi:anti-sigma regulatory factor (Ser/Thr protein kinase)